MGKVDAGRARPYLEDPTPQLRALRLTFLRWAKANWALARMASIKKVFLDPEDLAAAMMKTIHHIDVSGTEITVFFANGDVRRADEDWEGLMRKTAALCGFDIQGVQLSDGDVEVEPEPRSPASYSPRAAGRLSTNGATGGSFDSLKSGFADLKWRG